MTRTPVVPRRQKNQLVTVRIYRTSCITCIWNNKMVVTVQSTDRSTNRIYHIWTFSSTKYQDLIHDENFFDFDAYLVCWVSAAAGTILEMFGMFAIFCCRFIDGVKSINVMVAVILSSFSALENFNFVE
ncbi:hypothetical protein TNCT_297111 [Trichonephila clavata]|uniref:Uncharacterized protein n=1 Tax=Trichonephila clavata TaxID=2740835 RepID=A0A8X6FCA7_TRICU|nr:hypothetical protein TNCT_297111 [Trichonephila clavata]